MYVKEKAILVRNFVNTNKLDVLLFTYNNNANINNTLGSNQCLTVETRKNFQA